MESNLLAEQTSPETRTNNTQTINRATNEAKDEAELRSGSDRRYDGDRRRRAGGILEKRARREFNDADRRRRDRRDFSGSWLGSWLSSWLSPGRRQKTDNEPLT